LVDSNWGPNLDSLPGVQIAADILGGGRNYRDPFQPESKDMTEEREKSWTEADVQALIGQSETIRREFKAGMMFERKDQAEWVRELSIEVSAFANTEGGDIFWGIQEDGKARPRAAKAIDGVPTTLDSQRLQQLVEGNVSPYLPGIRFLRVKLSAASDRVVYVIQVPQGSTAYQANDGRYYGRSEFEAKYLPDHEIRLRMSRGKVARATVRLSLRRVALGAEHEAEIRANHATAIAAYRADDANAAEHFLELLEVIGARYHPDEISFVLVLRNEGELTIRDPVVEVREARSKQLFDGWTVQGGSLPPRLEMRGEVIYPGDEREIAGSPCQLRCKCEATIANGDYLIHWNVFLENSPPSCGEIDLGSEIQSPRRDRAGR
jgi:hypothetical protein